MLLHSGAFSALSDPAIKYTSAELELAKAQMMYEFLQRDYKSFCHPLCSLPERIAGWDDYILGPQFESRSKALKSISEISTHRPHSSAISRMRTTARLVLPSTDSSLMPSQLPSLVPCCCPVNPGSPMVGNHYHHITSQRPNMTSSLTISANNALLEELVYLRNQTISLGTLPSSTNSAAPPCHPSLSLLASHPSSTSVGRNRSTESMFGLSPSSVDHYLGQHVFSSQIPHHLRVHQHVNQLFKEHSRDPQTESYYAPGKELPTKSLKQAWRQERQSTRGMLNSHRQYTERPSSATFGTQKQYSSFPYENFPSSPYLTDTMARGKLPTNSIPEHAHNHKFYHLNTPPTYINQSNTRSPTLPQATDTTPLLHKINTSSNSQNIFPFYSSLHSNTNTQTPSHFHQRPSAQANGQYTPLNLSHLNSKPLSPNQTPSRILFDNSDSNTNESVVDEACNERLSFNPRSTSSQETGTQDEAIEEHFRRSLGQSYEESLSPKIVAVHFSEQTSSVDDHFSRALGNKTWTEIKARSEPTPPDSLSDTVDAHFSKALGAAMWEKLKGDNQKEEASPYSETGPKKKCYRMSACRSHLHYHKK